MNLVFVIVVIINIVKLVEVSGRKGTTEAPTSSTVSDTEAVPKKSDRSDDSKNETETSLSDYYSPSDWFLLAKKDDTCGILLYEELGCEPSSSWWNHEYTCPKLKQSNKYCYYKGVKYSDGEVVKTSSKCQTCFCSCPGDQPGNVICSKIKCSKKKIPNKCWEYYDLDDCCPKKSYCSNPHMAICVFNHEIHFEGQLFQPQNTCWECVCHKKFILFDKTYCRRMTCNLDATALSKIDKKCVPLYKLSEGSKALCCPKDYICEDDITSVVCEPRSFCYSVYKTIKEYIFNLCNINQYCYVGSEKVFIGEKFKLNLQTSKSKVHQCWCKTPPIPYCVEYDTKPLKTHLIH